MTRDLGAFIENGSEFKAKYLDEEDGPALAFWYEFGKCENGNVDIAAPYGDVFCNVPRELAEKLIELRKEFISAVILLIREAAKKFDET